MGARGGAVAQEKCRGALLRTGGRTMSRAPMTPKIEADTEHAIDFLQLLDKHGRHDLAAIDPHSGAIEAATFPAPVNWDLVRAWIDARQGRKNIYTSVNQASAEAPIDERLSAELI